MHKGLRRNNQHASDGIWGDQGRVQREMVPGAHGFIRIMGGVLWGTQAMVSLVDSNQRAGFGKIM